MPEGLLARHVRPRVLEALAESRAVALLGARQVGKSTLVADIATNEHPARLISLDDEPTANAARTDPAGFVAAITGAAVIDEVQRIPSLLLAIKRRLDSDQTRGQFLLTGSANLLTLPTVADALPGRVQYINLSPLSQGELQGTRETFIDALFHARFPPVSGARIGRAAAASMLVTGGYPELQDRSPRGRSSFFSSYIASITGRDLQDVANVRNVENIERLLYVIAARSGGLASFHGMAADLGIDTNTARAHTKILEDLFLVAKLQPWHVNLSSRQVKSPKLYILDSGLLAFLIGANERRIAEDGPVAGSMLGELRRYGDPPPGRLGTRARIAVSLPRQAATRGRRHPRAPQRRGRRDRGQGNRDPQQRGLRGPAIPTRQARRALQGRSNPLHRSGHASVRRSPRGRTSARTLGRRLNHRR